MNNPLHAPTPPDVGSILQTLRLERKLTLEDLSRTAGVSKSMLSQIERGKANPTIGVVWKLSHALGVEIGQLLTGTSDHNESMRIMESHETPTLSGHHSEYKLRILGPMDLAGKYEWYELDLSVNSEVNSHAHDPGTIEHLSVMSGTIEIEVDHIKKTLKPGTTARYRADQHHIIRNIGKNVAHALLVVVL